MKFRWVKNRQKGFTIVELLIVIVVIGILASIVVTAYNGIQKSASGASMRSDLSTTTKLMAQSNALTGAYPDVLPSEVRVSPGIELRLVKRVGGYSGLTNVQNGVLFRDVCQSLISEGYGTSTNLGGGAEQYVTDCNVYGYNAMQINGWHSQSFTVPLAQTAIYNWYNSNVSNDSWRPNKKTAILEFATELSNRFISLGGSFPVASFWDPWATTSNGGVQQQPLPAPNAPSSADEFCIEATHLKYNDMILHSIQTGKIADGSCPT